MVSSARVQVDVVPGQTEHLALAQAEDQDQDVGGVERVAVARADSRNCGLRRWSRPCALRLRTWRQLDQRGDVAA